MWLKCLEADRLRNLRRVSLDLPAGLTLVSGRNGQGKTSLLEAIYLLGTGRSFRTRSFAEIVARDGGPLRLSARVQRRLGEAKLSVRGDDTGRSMTVDGVERDLASYLGHLDLVAFPNERMKVLREGPDERRRFIDRGVLGLEPAYLGRLAEYRRSLHQRNTLLKGTARAIRSQELDVWDERLASSAVEIHRRRRAYLEALEPRLGGPNGVLFPDGEKLRLRYRPSPASSLKKDPASYGEQLLAALQHRRGRDRALGFTGAGPHRDELLIELDGVDLRKFGSGGQLRAAMIALKLGKLGLLGERLGDAPLFLMDDFDADLDEVRAGGLAEYLDSGHFQVLVATSKEGLMDRLPVPAHRVRMEDGRARAF